MAPVTVTQFTPFASFAGGILIGVAAVLMMAFNGRIAGISGLLARLLPPYGDTGVGQAAGFIAGLIAAPLLYQFAAGVPVLQTVSSKLPLMALAGLMVGFGTVYGSGCTSGHGVCGLARLSRRSFVATAIFIATGFITVFALRHLIGGS